MNISSSVNHPVLTPEPTKVVVCEPNKFDMDYEFKKLLASDAAAEKAGIDTERPLPPPTATVTYYRTTKPRDIIILGLNNQQKAWFDVMQDRYECFKKELRSVSPDLANKDFGFVVGKSGTLEVTFLEGALSAEEEKTINGLLNSTKGLLDAVMRHATAVMKSTQIDREKYKGMGAVELSDVFRLVNYGQALNKGAKTPDELDSPMDQLVKKIKWDAPTQSTVRETA